MSSPAVSGVPGTTVQEWLADRDPEFAEAFAQYLRAATDAGPLSPRERELLLLAHDASVTVLDEEGVGLRVRRARDAGATEAEVLGVLEAVALLSIHSLSTGLPLLYGPDEHPRPDDLRGGYWDDFESHLYTAGAALHIDGALRAGATRDEVAAAVAPALPCAVRTVELGVAALAAYVPSTCSPTRPPTPEGQP